MRKKKNVTAALADCAIDMAGAKLPNTGDLDPRQLFTAICSVGYIVPSAMEFLRDTVAGSPERDRAIAALICMLAAGDDPSRETILARLALAGRMVPLMIEGQAETLAEMMMVN
jgi:hypothetical protein